MLIRVLGPTLALLSFAVVCITGLARGNSFGSVVKGALLALVVGGAAGVLLAYVVRVVAKEGFSRQFREVAPPTAAAEPPQQNAAAEAPQPESRPAPSVTPSRN